ncbi:head morphogenesis protein [Rhizobium phage RHph_Y5A]|nr:head morphogenesis protein [Rhizobium phage RHph_Y5A]QIG75510.1 head morphogenesis protein [Rhizobium phage RHph_Y2_4]
MSNASRLAELIETKVPKRYRPTFTRFLDGSPDDEIIGAVADLVEGGAITAALRAIGDNKLAVVALALAKKLRDSFMQYVQVMRSEETLNVIQSLLARNSVDEVVALTEAPLTRIVETLKDGFSEAGKEMARDFSAAIEGMRPSNLTITFGNVANEARATETAATHSVYTVRDVADQIAAVDDQVKASKAATQAAINDAQEARAAAERAMKSVQAALRSAAQLRDIPGDVTGAISNSARAAIQAAEDAGKLADRAAAVMSSAPEEAAQAAIKAAQAARDAAEEVAAAKQTALDLENLARGLRPSVGISFDPTNPRAAASAQELAYQFIREVTDEQRDVVRQAVTDALGEGDHPKKAARDIRDSIGLTRKQNEAVKNYRRALETNSADALDRALRDRRFDRTVQRAQDTDTPLTPDQIDKMVDRYRERFVTYRADTIGLTESTTATSMANHEAMLQTLEMADIDPNDVEKKWNSTLDGRTRPSHVYLGAHGGQIVRGMDGLFMSGLGNRLMFPGDLHAPGADRIRCRCVCSYRIV